MSSKGTFPLNLKLYFSNLIGRNQEQVAKSNLTSKEFLHFGLHSFELEKLKIYVEFELRVLVVNVWVNPYHLVWVQQREYLHKRPEDGTQ